MTVDFQNIGEKSFPNFKGGEKSLEAKMFFDGKCRMLSARLEPGASIGLHTHDTSCEVILVQSGSGVAICDDIEEPVSAGTVHYCPKGHSHTLINNGTAPLCFLGIVPEQ